MYPITQAVKNLYLAGGVENITIFVSPVNNPTFMLTDSNLRNFSINRYCCSGGTIELGSAIASECTFTIDNTSGEYDNITFEGAEIYVYTMMTGCPPIPLGYYTIDTSPRKTSIIKIKALDRMMQLDKYASGITYPINITNMLTTICNVCGVELATIVSDNFMLVDPKQDNVTYRQLLQWTCQLLGCNAFMDWNGKLRLQQFSSVSSLTIPKSAQYDININEDAIEITGVRYETSDTVYLAGNETYCLDISTNRLVGNYASAVSKIFAIIGNFTYYPYKCTTMSFPFLYPMDSISLVDVNGNTTQSIITNITYTLNKHNTIQAVGKSQVQQSYATLNPLTNAESKIIEKIANEIAQNQVSTSTKPIIDFNNTITNSLGLYNLSYTDPITQATTYYLGDAPALANCSIIYTMTSNGFAWTNDWNSGNPVWTLGVDKNGNAILNYLSLNKLDANYIDVDTLAVKNLNGATGTFIRLGVAPTSVGANAGYIQAYTHDGIEITSGSGAGHSSITLDTADMDIEAADGEVTINDTTTTISSSYEVNITSPDNTINGATTINGNFFVSGKLNTNQYGTALPSSGTNGDIFFLITVGTSRTTAKPYLYYSGGWRTIT